MINLYNNHALNFQMVNKQLDPQEDDGLPDLIPTDAFAKKCAEAVILWIRQVLNSPPEQQLAVINMIKAKTAASPGLYADHFATRNFLP